MLAHLNRITKPICYVIITMVIACFPIRAVPCEACSHHDGLHKQCFCTEIKAETRVGTEPSAKQGPSTEALATRCSITQIAPACSHPCHDCDGSCAHCSVSIDMAWLRAASHDQTFAIERLNSAVAIAIKLQMEVDSVPQSKPPPRCTSSELKPFVLRI